MLRDLYVKGLHLGERWLPGARKHAGPVERSAPRPFPRHLRIISLYGEFSYFTSLFYSAAGLNSERGFNDDLIIRQFEHTMSIVSVQ